MISDTRYLGKTASWSMLQFWMGFSVSPCALALSELVTTSAGQLMWRAPPQFGTIWVTKTTNQEMKSRICSL